MVHSCWVMGSSVVSAVVVPGRECQQHGPPGPTLDSLGACEL